MSKKRDSWDKFNRQKKVFRPREFVSVGPSPLGGVVRQLLKRRTARIKAEQEAIDHQFKSEIRKVAISSALRPWMHENEINERFVIDAIKSELGKRPVRSTGKVIHFWMFCKDVEAIHSKFEGFTLSPPVEFIVWLLKFKRKAP